MKRLLIIAVIVTAAFAAGCGNKKTNADHLRATEWNLDEIIYKDSEFTETPPSDVSIMFSDSTDRIAGRGGCNNFFGTYEIKGDDQLTIKVIGNTLMACPELVFEEKYLNMLDAMDKFAATKEELRLVSTTTGTTLVYKPVFKAVQ